jgi:tetratricopeptide (TPR) repeat protein
LGQFYLDRGRRVEAEAMAERTEKLCANAPIAQQFDVLRNLAELYANLGDVSKQAALYARLMPVRRTMPQNPDLVWLERGRAEIAAGQGRFREAENLYRRAIGILDYNGIRNAEAILYDALARIYEEEGARAAAEARAQAKSLRAGP